MTVSCCSPVREQTVLLWTAGGQRGSGGPRAALGQQSARKQGCQPHIWRSEFCQHHWACKWTFRGGQLDFSQYCWTEVPANEGKDLHLGSPETRDLAWGCTKFEEETRVCPEKGPWGGGLGPLWSLLYLPSPAVLHHLSLLRPVGMYSELM